MRRQLYLSSYDFTCNVYTFDTLDNLCFDYAVDYI